MSHKISKKIRLCSLIVILISLHAQADHHVDPGIPSMSNGTIEAHQATLCKLNSGKTLKDAENLIPAIRKLHKEIDYDPFFGILTPLFVSPQGDVDFIFMDFAPFTELSGAWDKFLVSDSGKKVQASIDKVATCGRVMHRYYHQYSKFSEDNQRIFSVNWCTKKPGVTMENLMAKHRSFLNPVNPHILHWGIAAPAWGNRDGDTPGEFAHFMGYPDMEAAFADQSDIAQDRGWEQRRDYFTSYANCSGENLWQFNIVNMPKEQ